MGLEEKRLVKELQDENVPAFEAALKNLSGASIKLEIDWPSLAEDEKALRAFDFDGLQRVQTAIEAICRDEIGKKALKTGLKKYKVKNITDPQKKKLSFEGGVLKIEAAFGADWSEGVFTEAEIQELMEDKL